MIRMRLASQAVQSQRCNMLSRGRERAKSEPESRLQCCAHTYTASSSRDALAMANSDDKTDRPTNFLITAAPYLLLRPNCIRHKLGLFLVALLFLICLNSTNSIRCAAPAANCIRAWVTRFFVLLNSVRGSTQREINLPISMNATRFIHIIVQHSISFSQHFFFFLL